MVRFLQEHVRSHGDHWQPQLFLEKCEALKGASQQDVEFCCAIVNVEWRLLIDSSISKLAAALVD